MPASSHQTDGQPAFLDRLGNWIRRIPLPVRRRWVTPTVFQMEALGMRRGLARDDPGVSWPLGGTGNPARSMRRLPGRQQSQQRAEGCARLRADSKGIQEGAGDAA